MLDISKSAVELPQKFPVSGLFRVNVKVIDSRPNNFGVGLMLCLLAFTQVACDQSNNEEPVERALETVSQDSAQPASTGQASTNADQPAGQIVANPQNKTAVAPGNIVVMALSSHDARAVVKTADGEMQAMQPGDTVAGTAAVLVDVLTDRLVLEEVVTRPSGQKVKQTVWVYKGRDGVSRVQVLSRNAPAPKEYKVTKTTIASE